jgi:hypothetical protein
MLMSAFMRKKTKFQGWQKEKKSIFFMFLSFLIFKAKNKARGGGPFPRDTQGRIKRRRRKKPQSGEAHSLSNPCSEQRPFLSDDGLEVSLPFRRLKPSSSSNNLRRWSI